MALKSICIVGPGAIGGMIAVHMQRAGYDVSALARPEKVAAIKAKGLTLIDGGQTYLGQPKAASDPAELGPHDLVVVTVKGGGLASIAPHLAALSRPDTPWVFVMNGVPWWFFEGFGGKLQGTTLKTLDPEQHLSRVIPLSRLIWGVINCNVALEADGTIRHVHSKQLQIGRPDGSVDELPAIAEVFRNAGYNTDTTGAIRQAIWGKLLVNMTFNPISVLTMATTNLMLGDPLVRELAINAVDEGRAIGQALGLDGGPTGAQRFAGAGQSGVRAKTSMLADVERGRALEIEPLIGVVVEIADLCGVSVPFTKALYGLIRLRGQTLLA